MSGPYDVLMIDPPWPIGTARATAKGRTGYGKRVGVAYRTVPLDALWDVIDRDVLSRAAEGATVFLWCLDRFLFSAEQAMEQRGYCRHVRLIWHKGDSGMTPCATVRFCHEYLLWFYHPPLRAPAKEAQGRYSTVIQSGRRENSRKPSAAYAMVEALYPDARRLDAFTREYRQNWDSFGDQVDHFTPLLAPLREKAEVEPCPSQLPLVP